MWIMSEKSNDAREYQPAKAGIKSLNAAEEFGFAKNIYIYIQLYIYIYRYQMQKLKNLDPEKDQQTQA